MFKKFNHLAIGGCILRELTVGHGQHAVRPLVAYGVELAVQLAHGDALGVDDLVLDTELLHLSAVLQVAQHAGEDLEAHAFAAQERAADHEAVAHQHHFVNLLREWFKFLL